MGDDVLLGEVRDYYEGRLDAFGATAKGVDWNSAESQELRFDQLVPAQWVASNGSVLDYGCGYGALLTYLRELGWSGAYTGYDVSREMLVVARRLHGADGQFIAEPSVATWDCTLASGLFNVRLGFGDDRWEAHISAVLDEMWCRTGAVMVFNMLTIHSDPDRRRENLYYADPSRFLDLCLRRYSRRVLLRHGYGLYEFTVQVEK